MEKNKCEFVSASECFDTSSAMGKAMMGILAIFAQMERENIQKRVKDTYYYITAETGSWAGGPAPYGYKNGRNEKGKQNDKYYEMIYKYNTINTKTRELEKEHNRKMKEYKKQEEN